MDGETLGKRIKALREKAGVSQQTIAVAAGLSVSMVAQMEQGKKEDPRLSTLSAIADALAVSLDELAGRKPAGTFTPPKRRKNS
jgi:transcriptional regulator with XRE-family HTH domain